jgi:hypothetical protein
VRRYRLQHVGGDLLLKVETLAPPVGSLASPWLLAMAASVDLVRA